MSKYLMCTMLGLSLPWLTGCGAAAGTVRGQTPTEHVQVMPTGESHHTPMIEEVVVDGDEDVCNYCGAHCHGTCNMCMGYGWRPHHRHTYVYRRPELSYPPSNGPTGTVVYPYYTVKGPDDFFLK
ncbi:MAG: hypothetical protein ACKVT0_21320 [Planctomycetaceae bacterium]